MLFNSVPFLFGLLPITYLGFWLLRGSSRRHFWLALTGYVFYASWNSNFCGVMAFSTVVSYFAGLAMLKWRSGFARRLCLIIPVTIDLSLLALFKYADFALSSAAGAART